MKKKYLLPHWCKRIGIVSSVIFLIIGAIIPFDKIQEFFEKNM